MYKWFCPLHWREYLNYDSLSSAVLHRWVSRGLRDIGCSILPYGPATTTSRLHSISVTFALSLGAFMRLYPTPSQLLLARNKEVLHWEKSFSSRYHYVKTLQSRKILARSILKQMQQEYHSNYFLPSIMARDSKEKHRSWKMVASNCPCCIKASRAIHPTFQSLITVL